MKDLKAIACEVLGDGANAEQTQIPTGARRATAIPSGATTTLTQRPRGNFLVPQGHKGHGHGRRRGNRAVRTTYPTQPPIAEEIARVDEDVCVAQMKANVAREGKVNHLFLVQKEAARGAGPLEVTVAAAIPVSATQSEPLLFQTSTCMPTTSTRRAPSQAQ